MITVSKQSLQRWLQLHCESCTDVVGGMVAFVQNGTDDPYVVAEWPRSDALSNTLKSTAQAAMKRDRLVVVTPVIAHQETGYNRVIALPLISGQAAVGAVSLAVRVLDSAGLDSLVKQLGQACVDISVGLSKVDPSTMATSNLSDPALGRSDDIGMVLDLQASLLGHATLAQGAFAMATELAHHLGCERMALGALQNQRLEVVAVSGSTDFKDQQQLLRAMAAAMQEAVDQQAPVFYPANPTDPARIVLAHAEMSAHEGTALASFPLVSSGQVAGAMLIECRMDKRLAADQIALCEVLAVSLGGLVALRQRAERPWHVQAWAWCRGVVARLWAPNDPMAKVAALGAALVLVGLLAVPVSYRVGAPVRVEGAQQQVLAAPLDGYIRHALVRPGDAVSRGMVLLEMADQDLLLEQRKWESNLAQSENGFASALARGDRAQFIIHQGKATEAQAQLDLVRQQLGRTRLIAPVDGVVIKGDLTQSMGAPVQRGDVLLTLVPKEAHRLIMAVDERDIASLQPGMRGLITLAALPGEALPMVVERITPVASVSQGRNAFEVEAKLTSDSAVLRYGMQGVAKVEVGNRSVLWIWTHRAWHWLRMAVWTWIN